MKKSNIKYIGSVLIALVLTACGGNSGGTVEEPVNNEYQISMTNLTAGQPLSPMSVILHNQDWRAFTLGESVSTDIERIAEAGDNSALLASAEADSHVFTTQRGNGVIRPGNSDSIIISSPASGTLSLSVLSMLGNTNDAITALNAADISSLEIGESVSYRIISYDAGTEANTESLATVPGPAAGGEGFNPVRDDVRDAIYVHAGVVTQDDGLTDSALTQLHRWDNPTAMITVSRTK